MKLISGKSIPLIKTWLRNKEHLDKNISQIKDLWGKS